MFGKKSVPKLLISEYPQALLERTLTAEYLLSQGYLVSEIEILPNSLAESLMSNAATFVARRLTELNSGDILQQMFRLPMSLN